jgi:Fe-S cluster biogenesis protein NfuA
MNRNEFQTHTEQLDRLVQRVTAIPDDEARNTALELLQSVMDLHGAAMSGIVELLSQSDAGRISLSKLGNDPLICGLLVLYGVHPVPMEERISHAIDKVRPKIQKNGGGVDLLEITEDTVRVALHSSGTGCHSSPDALKQLVEEAILEAAPEVVDIVADGVPGSGSGFIPLSMIKPVTREGGNYEKSAA